MTVTTAISADAASAALDRTLTSLAGREVAPREGQLEAVTALVVERGRVLVVQATGWGKSAVYWAATAANRAAGAGPTLVVSPLLALMRDQVAAAARAGITAATINSTNADEWDAVFAGMASNGLDVILVSPERLASPSFTARLGQLTAGVGMIVIDEAHCLSDWGFDFRPDYQRISRALLANPDIPVLATTATANQRVTDDVAAQLGEATTVIRGSLARSSLRLDVVSGLAAAERWAWVHTALSNVEGSGIVYALTVAEAERLAAYLTDAGHDVAAYTGQSEPSVRAEIEQRLHANSVKAVVATSALGMGYDKADLAFVFHVGSPSSPVAMYQQVGRAGRAIDDAVAVLLPAETDERLWEYFATSGIPDPALAEQVLTNLSSGPASLPALEQATGARRNRLESLLKVMSVDGAVARAEGGWAATGQPWVFDADRYAALRRARAAEAELMRRYATAQQCLMMLLQQTLDDPDPQPCGRCGVCTGAPVVAGAPPADAVDDARRWMRAATYRLEPRKMWPSGAGRRGRIAGADEGRAVTFADDQAWPEVVADVNRGVVGPASRQAAVEVLGRWRHEWAARPTCVVSLPGPDGGPYAGQLAEHVAEVGKLPSIDALRWNGGPALTDCSSAARVASLAERLSVPSDTQLAGATVLLVASTMQTGWTLTLAAALLREAGAERVLPLVANQRP
jgi:ATP-dependent DNA helicase RecQ